MRVTYLHQYFNTPAMPGGTRSYEMARRLVAMGHEVNLVTSWRENDEKKGWFETDESGIRVHWLPIPYSNNMSFTQRVRAFVRFAISAAGKAASIDSDVVFASSTPLTISIPGMYASFYRQIPMVFEVRDLWPEVPIAMGALNNFFLKWLARKLELATYKRASAVVALSDGMKAGVLATGYAPEIIETVPNSCDLDGFKPDPIAGATYRAVEGLPQEPLLVTYAGTFGRVNGVSYIVNLATALRGDGRFYFLLVGAGAEKKTIVALAEESGVLNFNLRIIDEVTKECMPNVLAATDIAISTIIPSTVLEMNSANKFFDGLSAGCCMAVNYGGWQAELIQEREAGLRLDRDVIKAANQLKALADNPARLAKAKIAAREIGERQFSRDDLASRLEEILIRAIETGLDVRKP
ncbi:glycosyltransferase family 4 protein [Luminiphilus sp.]|nr:glycosyltransferase family 4 protein [Luminiphilus sp.]